ncbi:hypothetical protein [Priestia endophytica]|uniref:hypothetical protein n=1 Tax=Priestia endophytica TaxID=135735 RepID=UPI00204227F6|nr:hypothetical protein [Priestia endophytica]MCM3538679.1 hypothetical protein [Priestia endophytica]
MDIEFPVWFILSTYLIGLTFIYLGYRICAKQQLSLIGSGVKLKNAEKLNTVCKLTGIYSVVLGTLVMAIPMFNLFFNLFIIMFIVGITIIASTIFWFALQKIYFVPFTSILTKVTKDVRKGECVK